MFRRLLPFTDTLTSLVVPFDGAANSAVRTDLFRCGEGRTRRALHDSYGAVQSNSLARRHTCVADIPPAPHPLVHLPATLTALHVAPVYPIAFPLSGTARRGLYAHPFYAIHTETLTARYFTQDASLSSEETSQPSISDARSSEPSAILQFFPQYITLTDEKTEPRNTSHRVVRGFQRS